MRSRRRGLIAVVLASALSGCVAGKGKSDVPLGPLDHPGLTETGGGLSQVDLKNIDLTGQNDISIPGVTPPTAEFGTSTGLRTLSVVSARTLPVADKVGHQVVGWRFLGELENGTNSQYDNGHMVVQITTAGQDGAESTRTLLPTEVQPGGFLPVRPGERAVYDTLIAEPISPAQRLTVGIRPTGTNNPSVRLGVENLSLKRTTAEDGSFSGFMVHGTIRNTQDAPVTELLVRYWATVENRPAGEKSANEVMAVGTFQAVQDVLVSGQGREFDADLMPLTIADRERLATASARLSAMAAGKVLK